MKRLMRDREYTHCDPVNNNNYRVLITNHMFKKRVGAKTARGSMFKTHGQIARLLQYALTRHSIDEYEGKGVVLLQFTYKGYVNGLLLAIDYNEELDDVVSEITLISACNAKELNANKKSIFRTVRQRIDMTDYDLKPHDHYIKYN